MKPIAPLLSSLLVIISNTCLDAQEYRTESSTGFADSIHLQAVEILGFRSPDANKEREKLTPLEQISHDAGAVLSRIPAINGIRKGGGYGYDPVLRGFKYSQIGILIDGIQTTTVACPNRMDPPTSQVSVNTLSSVEVQKGPYSLRYGNHIGGVINFLSSPPEPENGYGIFGRVSAGYETNGSIKRSEAVTGISKEKYSSQLAGSWHKGSDYRDGNGEMIPASFTRANFALSAEYRPGEHQEFRARVTRNFARNADYAALPMDLRSDDTWLIHLAHDAHLGKTRGKTLRSSAYASLVDHLMDNAEKQLEPRMVNASTTVKTSNFGARTALSGRGRKSSYAAGIDINYEMADGFRTRDFLMGPNAGNTMIDNVWQKGRIIRSGMFIEYSSRLEHLRYTLSGRFNVNSADALDPDESFSSLYSTLRSTQVNPGLTGGIEYQGKLLSYALWTGRVQRSGNLSERYMNSFPVGLDPYELIGNPGLRPEVNNQADLIITLDNRSRTRVKVDIFFAYLQDFISSVIRPELTPKMPSAPGVRQYENIEKASIAGVEISLNQELPLHLMGSMDVAAQIGKNLVNAEPLPEIPPLDLRVALSGSYFQNRLSVSLASRVVAQQSRISTEFGEHTTPGFWLMDVDISYRALGRLTFSAGIRNLFDRPYYEHLNRAVLGSGEPIYNPGRNIYAGCSFSF